MTTSPIQIIKDAEREAREAENLVSTLEGRVKDGDESVTFEEVEKAKGLLSFVKLRGEAATRKAAAATEAARLQACEDLNADIQAIVKGDGKQFSKQLETAVDALRTFYDAVEARNEKVRSFRKRAEALGIPEHKGHGTTSAKHGGVGLAANGGHVGSLAGVVVGKRYVDSIDANTFVNRALNLLSRSGTYKPMEYVDAGVDLFGDLSAIDAEAKEDSATHFYLAPNGGVIRKDDPYPPEEIQRLSLTVITKEQADAA